MTNLGWKFYIINASWNVIFLLIVVFLWVETRGLTLEDIALKQEGITYEDVIIGEVSKEAVTMDGREISCSEKTTMA